MEKDPDRVFQEIENSLAQLIAMLQQDYFEFGGASPTTQQAQQLLTDTKEQIHLLLAQSGKLDALEEANPYYDAIITINRALAIADDATQKPASEQYSQQLSQALSFCYDELTQLHLSESTAFTPDSNDRFNDNIKSNPIHGYKETVMYEDGFDLEFVDKLTRFFSLKELDELCFLLKINSESIGGTVIEEKARELYRYVWRNGRLHKLKKILREKRAHVPW